MQSSNNCTKICTKIFKNGLKSWVVGVRHGGIEPTTAFFNKSRKTVTFVDFTPFVAHCQALKNERFSLKMIPIQHELHQELHHNKKD